MTVTVTPILNGESPKSVEYINHDFDRIVAIHKDVEMRALIKDISRMLLCDAFNGPCKNHN